MIRCSALVFAVAIAPLQAQENLLSSEAQQAWARTKGKTVAAAEKMPEEHYGFKPSPESQSFGDLVAHTAAAAMRTCASATGGKGAAPAEGGASKAVLVAALASAVAECDKANGAMTDANATDMIEGRRGARSRLGTLYGNTVHIEHEYAQMAVHMRLKGLVPPSTARRR